MGLLLLGQSLLQHLDNGLQLQRLGGHGERAIGRDLVVLDALHGGRDHQIQDRPLSMLIGLGCRLVDEAFHSKAQLAPGLRIHRLKDLVEAADLILRLLDVSLDGHLQQRRAGLARGLLHAAKRLLFRAIDILQLFQQQLFDFVFHAISPVHVRWSAPTP
jgi:hypothetical protein